MNESDLTPTERAAALAHDFNAGKSMTVADISQQYGITHSGAYRLTVRISRVIPLACDEAGLWRIMRDAT